GDGGWLLRLALFCSAASVIYLGPANAGAGTFAAMAQDAYLIVLAAAVAVAIRLGAGQAFSTTPLDVLLVIAVLAAGFLGFRDPGSSGMAALLLRLAVLFYGCELAVSGMGWRRRRANALSVLGVAFVLLVKVFATA
ncbi:MAG: hypothetical protein WBP72_17885, partial [Rhodocyclaceae bacterium]